MKSKLFKTNRTYFIADIAANHDGDLKKAKELIYLCAEAGADAAKFQHFSAETIVSDYGFKSLKEKKSHQKAWKKSVFEVYKDASRNLNWTLELKKTCKKAGIDFLSSPYSSSIPNIFAGILVKDLRATSLLNPYSTAFRRLSRKSSVFFKP